MCSTVPYYIWDSNYDWLTQALGGEFCITGCTVCKCLLGFGPVAKPWEEMEAAQREYEGEFNG